MAVNIGPKIGIDGEREYRKQINDLITQQKTFSAEMRELESSFDDNASAMDKNRKKGELLEKSIQNQEKQVEELEKGLEASRQKYGDNATQTQKWQQAVSNAKTELNKMRSELEKVPKPLAEVGKGMQDAGKKMQKVGGTLTKYVTAPLTAVGAASIAAFKEVDDGLDQIAKITGATGENLKALENSAKNIATTIPTSFDTAGAAIGEVNTRFGVTGGELESLTTQFIKFADLNNTDVSTSINNVQKVMAAFGVETQDAGKLLDAMNATGQKTGVSMDSLQQSMLKNATALQDMGLNAYDAAQFLGQVETSGADSAQVMTGLQKALVNAADDGKTLPQALGEFQTVMNSTATEQEKLTAATDLFGKKAGPAIYNACKTGSLSFESLSADASEYLGSVESTFDAVLDPADDFTVAMNSLKVLGSEVGESLLVAAAPALQTVGIKLKNAADKFASLDAAQQEFIIKAGVAFAAGGPVLSGIGRVTEGIGGIITKASEMGGVPASIAAFLTNPLGLAMVAATGLIGALSLVETSATFSDEKIAGVVDDTTKAVEAMDTATESLSGTMDETKASLEAIEGQADAANELIDELSGLEKQSSLTAEQQSRMSSIVSELNSLYPGLNLQIDSQSGKLNKTTKEMKSYVEQSKKMKMLEAYQNAATKGYEELATAHVALNRAQKQEADNLTVINGLESEKARIQGLVNDGFGNLYDSEGNYIMRQEEAKTALEQVTADLRDANAKQQELNTATTEAQSVYDTATQNIADYDTAAEEISAELDAATTATGENTSAMDTNAAAANANGEAVGSWAQRIAEATAGVVEGVAGASAEWSNLYTQTRDSITKQLNMFDEWEQDSELSFKQMRKNLKTQIEGMNNYADNMGKLSKAAVESSDPNFKALVQHLATMGIDAAGEVQTLVDAMENKPKLFNKYVAMFGEDYQVAIDNVAAIQTYVESDFTTGTQKGLVSVKNAFTNTFSKGGIQTALQGFGKVLINSTKTSTDTATNYTTTKINGMKLEPGVNKVQVPDTVIGFAKDVMNKGLNGVQGKVTKINGAGEAAKTAKTTAEGKLSTISGKVSKISVSSDALSTVRNSISNFLANNPVTTWIRAHVSPTKHADGGFTYTQQLSWLSEGNKPEVVIPLSSAKRQRALDLYQETGERLGVASPRVETFSINDPAQSQQSVRLQIDADRMYEACAAGAKAGMENADIKIYIGDREAGRILRNMGVAFA